MASLAVHLVSLGCAKNSVDTASMAELLVADGLQLVGDPRSADVVVVNTCGFIEAARSESLAVLRELAAAKPPGQSLVAAGCLSQLWGSRLIDEVPGVDGVLGTRRWMDIVPVVRRMRAGRPRQLLHLPDAPRMGPDPSGVLRAQVQGGSAYLKIADGCRRPCSFCAIPRIKGPMVSRPVDSVVADARALRDAGVIEVNLIAQDTTDYGADLGLKDGLALLLERLTAEVPDLPWIRVLYAYPGRVTERVIDAMAAHGQVLPYLDIPLQHSNDAVLRRMRRPSDVDAVRRALTVMRQRIGGLALRTTFIVGFPGETEAEFQALLEFLEDVRFDHVGAFQYSPEAGTAAAEMVDDIAAEVKQERWDRLMARQQAVSLAANQAWIGRALDVLVEGANDGVSLGRSYRDAPEVDGLVIIEGELPVGRLARVHVTGAMAYDLTAVSSSAAASGPS